MSTSRRVRGGGEATREFVGSEAGGGARVPPRRSPPGSVRIVGGIRTVVMAFGLMAISGDASEGARVWDGPCLGPARIQPHTWQWSYQ